MEWGTLFTGFGDALLESAPVVIPIALTTFAALAAFGLGFKFLRKGGVRA